MNFTFADAVMQQCWCSVVSKPEVAYVSGIMLKVDQVVL